MFDSLALVGDTKGLPRLLRCVPLDKISVLVAASIRPDYIEPLKKIANAISKPLLIQPKYNTSEYTKFMQQMKLFDIDMLLCDSYSMIIRPDVLQLVKYNAINIHAALLPKNRGPNPIQWSIIKGELSTGVTMHYMSDSIDAGDIIYQEEIRIENDDTWVSLSDKIDFVSEKMIGKNIGSIIIGKNPSVIQEEKLATINIRITRDFPLIEFERMSITEIYNLIRAQIFPLGGAYFLDSEKEYHTIEQLISEEEIMLLKIKYFDSLINNS
jgi:methionyl-tRNA formyltransferase